MRILVRMNSCCLRVARGDSGAKAPLLAARLKVGSCSGRGRPECDFLHLGWSLSRRRTIILEVGLLLSH